MCVVRTACMYAHAYMCISACITAPVCVCVRACVRALWILHILCIVTLS